MKTTFSFFFLFQLEFKIHRKLKPLGKSGTSSSSCKTSDLAAPFSSFFALNGFSDDLLIFGASLDFLFWDFFECEAIISSPNLHGKNKKHSAPKKMLKSVCSALSEKYLRRVYFRVFERGFRRVLEQRLETYIAKWTRLPSFVLGQMARWA